MSAKLVLNKSFIVKIFFLDLKKKKTYFVYYYLLQFILYATIDGLSPPIIGHMLTVEWGAHSCVILVEYNITMERKK